MKPTLETIKSNDAEQYRLERTLPFLSTINLLALESNLDYLKVNATCLFRVCFLLLCNSDLDIRTGASLIKLFSGVQSSESMT